MDSCCLRLAQENDAEAILDIYRPYVEKTVITFEYEVPHLEEFKERITDISAEYPYLVCETEGKIVGYAYAHRHMKRAAYQWNAELSVYIDEKYTSQGIGKKLYASLMEILKLQNVRNLYCGVTVPNPKSEKLNEHFEFKKLGTYHQTGYKNGQWLDVAWYEKRISTDDPPKPFIPISGISSAKIQEIFKANR